MKRLLIFLFILVCGAVSAQKINQAFTRASGERFILNLSDIAFAYATDTGSTLVLGPSVKTVYVTESIDSVAAYSGGALQKFTEIRRGLSGGVTRPVAVSLNHVSEAVRSTTPQGTLIKMKNPVMTVLVSDTITTVIKALTRSEFANQDFYHIVDTTDMTISSPGTYVFEWDDQVDSFNILLSGSELPGNNPFHPGDVITLYFGQDVDYFSMTPDDIGWRDDAYPAHILAGTTMRLRLIDDTFGAFWSVESTNTLQFHVQRQVVYSDSTDFEIKHPGIYVLDYGSTIDSLVITIADETPENPHPAFRVGDEVSFYIAVPIAHLTIVPYAVDLVGATALQMFDGSTDITSGSSFTLKLINVSGSYGWILTSIVVAP